MQVFFVKYIQVFCMTLFFTNNVSCDQVLMQNGNERLRLFAVSACASECLSSNESRVLQECYEQCEDTPFGVYRSVRQIYENLDMKLLCRDDTTLVLRITKSYGNKTSGEVMGSNNNDLMNSGLYVIQIHSRDDLFKKEQIYLTNSSLITIENLDPNTKYNISAAVVYNNYEYSSIAHGLPFVTLQKRYIPKEITSITLQKYEMNNMNPYFLDAIISWKPAVDKTCYYDIVYYSPERRDVDFIPVPIRRPETLYTHTLEGLSFDTEYTIAVRGRNTKDSTKEGNLVWHIIKTPSCLEWYNNNLTVCPPLKPSGLKVDEQYLTANLYALNITWNKPVIEPDYYLLKVLDLTLIQNSESNSMTVNVTKGQTYQFLSNVALTGHQYEILLTAFSFGGNSSILTRHSKMPLQMPEKHQILKLLVAIVVPIICIAVVSLLIVVICHRRAKLKRYQERCKYFEELEEKAPVDPKSTFQFISKNLPIIPPASNVHQISSLQQGLENILYINDEMEVERENVALLEILGEGAFGLVRKGILKVGDNEEREVAVKMLKDRPSSDDIKEFRREIEVMKFVGKHPNIVGIVGHCTKYINEMLLLTEYCSLGNLLNFLRSEWNYLNKIKVEENICQVPAIENLTPFLASEKQPENVFNFDTSIVDKISLKYKNISNNDKSTDKTNVLSKAPNKSDNGLNPENLAVNKLYDLNSSCTNKCKCEVDIALSDDKCLKRDNNSVEKQTDYKIKIHNCECASKCIKATDVKISPLGVENQGYYKLLNDNKENSSFSNLKKYRKRERLTSGDLLQIAKQIATGMEFLSKNRVVHRDLAARNVLVCEDRTVKIADFGLSRDIYQENIYKKIGNGKLPIKWLALESMTHQVYTSQSDVWAYGILLYEIITLGSTPYPSIPTNQLLDLLKTGYRMERPKNCSEQFYSLMLSCWDINPSERPSFTEICQALDNMLFNSPEEEIINLNLTEIVNKRSKSSSDESYLKPL